MVQDGFLDMGERLTRVEGRMDGLEGRMDGLESRMGDLEHEMAKLRNEFPKYATASMHEQLSRRVVAIEGHLGL